MVGSVVFGGVIGIIAPLLDFAGVSVAADVVTVVITTAFFLPYYAIIASAYLQLRDEQEPFKRAAQETVDASQTAEL